MAITQKWHTSRGTACDTERAATIREDAENLAADAHKQVPGLPFKLAADMLTVLMTEGKLRVPTPDIPPASAEGADTFSLQPLWRVEEPAPQSAEDFYQQWPTRQRIKT